MQIYEFNTVIPDLKINMIYRVTQEKVLPFEKT